MATGINDSLVTCICGRRAYEEHREGCQWLRRYQNAASEEERCWLLDEKDRMTKQLIEAQREKVTL